MSEVKNIMDALGRGMSDGEVRGSHLGQILQYLQQHKTEKMRSTLNKLALICGMQQRYLRESYINGLEDFGVISVRIEQNEKIWNWVGERAFNSLSKEESLKDYVERKEKEKGSVGPKKEK